jgi:thiamine kinase-like enzyme
MMRQKDKKFFLIDNEYASLNLLGYDISYYICESHFNYENLYNFSFPLIDIDKCFNEYYMKYINIFLDNNKNNFNE